MTGADITVPLFSNGADGVEHFFGTRLSTLTVTPGCVVPRRSTSPDSASVVLAVKQVHGTDALVIDRAVNAGERFDGGWDAVVTDQPGVMVTVRTADCVPVLLYDPERRVVAAVHAGWRGAVGGIVSKTAALLVERFGATAVRLRIAIGPSAGPCCYEVDEPVLARLRAVCTEWRSVVEPVGTEKARLDLRAFIRRQMVDDGIRAEHIATVEACTICEPARFYSYRREGVVKATMVSGIALRPVR